MRLWIVFASFVAAGLAVPAAAQPVEVRGGAGPTLVDRGYSLGAGAGWSPWSRVTVSISAERTHVFSRVRTDSRGSTSAFRGGTLLLGAGELRLSLFPANRVTPYVLAGFAAGVSRLNVNPTFPDPASNDVRAVFAGGGVQVPLRPGLAVFVDGRLMLGDEANELFAVAPLRAGLAWRF